MTRKEKSLCRATGDEAPEKIVSFAVRGRTYKPAEEKRKAPTRRCLLEQEARP
jgi:hypothetical protein